MQDNLQDIPSVYVLVNVKLNAIPSEQNKLSDMSESELPSTAPSYSTLKMNFTQAEIGKIRIKSMSEYVLAALVKCPVAPAVPVAQPPPAAVCLIHAIASRG